MIELVDMLIIAEEHLVVMVTDTEGTTITTVADMVVEVTADRTLSTVVQRERMNSGSMAT